MNYDSFIHETRKKYYPLEKILDKESNDRVISSLRRYNSIHEYFIAKSILPHLNISHKILILASWFSIPILEVLVNEANFHSITLLDHDPNVPKIGNEIKRILRRGDSIKYFRKDIIFDDIQTDIDQSHIIIIPSVNRLIPINDILVNLKKGTIVCLAGTNDTFKAYNTNPIFCVDDLNQQLSFDKIIYSYEFMEANMDRMNIKTSVLVGQV